VAADYPGEPWADCKWLVDLGKVVKSALKNDLKMGEPSDLRGRVLLGEGKLRGGPPTTLAANDQWEFCPAPPDHQPQSYTDVAIYVSDEEMSHAVLSFTACRPPCKLTISAGSGSTIVCRISNVAKKTIEQHSHHGAASTDAPHFSKFYDLLAIQGPPRPILRRTAGQFGIRTPPDPLCPETIIDEA
jgi:hypothetical protein